MTAPTHHSRGNACVAQLRSVIIVVVTLIISAASPLAIAKGILMRHQYLPKWSPDGQKYACIEVGGLDEKNTLHCWLTLYQAKNHTPLVSIPLTGLGQITAQLFPKASLTSTEVKYLGLVTVPSGFSWSNDSEHYVFINGTLAETPLRSSLSGNGNYQQRQRYYLVYL